MRFTILGPVEVSSDGVPLPDGSARERCVLAELLIEADRTVTTDRLIDALWLEPPQSAKAQIHNMIRNLRKRLRTVCDDEVITTRPLGYELRLGDHELDLVEFRRLAESGHESARSGDHETAANRFDEALALWRGPALRGVPDDLAAAARESLGEERLAVQEARIRSALAAGDHDRVLRDLDGLIASQPYRERLHEMRLRALAAAGRRADALAAYQEAYRRLSDDLGIEPGPALRDLEQRILRGDSAEPSTASVPPPRQLPGLPGTVTGRDKLIKEVGGELRRTGPGPVTALLVGPGGIGKTTLALAVAYRVADVFAQGQLYANLRGSHADPADPYDVLGAFLRALDADGSPLPDSLDERQALYRTRLADTRTLIVLDDAADERQVRPLLPGTAGSSVLVTSRQRLGALIDAARWSVPVLPVGDAVELLARIVGRERLSDDPRTGEALVDACGRLPLAVSIAAARLALHEDWTLDEFTARLSAERLRLDELSLGDLDVRSSIALSYEGLDDASRTLFRRLGLSSAPQWPAWVAAELLGTDAAPRIDRRLDALADVHLVEPIGRDAAGQSRYRLHDLVAEFALERAVAEETEADRNAAVHRLVDGWLALATEADQHVAHGQWTADGLTGPPVPAQASTPTATSATTWFEIERDNLARAVTQADAVGAHETAAKIALRTSGFLTVRGDDHGRIQLLQTALRHDGSEPEVMRLRVRLLGALLSAQIGLGRHSELQTLVHEQLQLARRIGDARGEYFALREAGRTALRLNRLSEAAEHYEAAIAVELPSEDERLRAWVVGALGIVYIERGDPERGEPMLARHVAAERARGRSMVYSVMLMAHAETLAILERLDDAQAALDEMRSVCTELGDDVGIACSELRSADVDLRAGRVAEAAELLDRSLPRLDAHADAGRDVHGLRVAADLAAAERRWSDAADLADEAARLRRTSDQPLDAARDLARAEIAHRARGDDPAAADRRQAWQTILADLELDERSLLLPAFLTRTP